MTDVEPPLRPEPDAVAGQGVEATNAAAWHAAGLTGAGVKIAVIDSGFAGYTDRIAGGDLPASLITVDYTGGAFSTATEHGTGVAEIVLEMAPGAQLYLIAVADSIGLGQAKDYVKSQGIQVVSHSMSWFNSGRGDGGGGPGTPDAIVADARASGILWVNSAGNYAQSHWSGSFSDADGDNWHNYTSTDEGNTVTLANGATIKVWLKWDDWAARTQDYDLYLKKSGEGTTVASSTRRQGGSLSPTEYVTYTNDTGASANYYTATPTPSPTAIATATTTASPIATKAPTSTQTGTVPPTATATPTSTGTPTATLTASSSPTPTDSSTPGPTATAPGTPTQTPTPMPTATSTPTSTALVLNGRVALERRGSRGDPRWVTELLRRKADGAIEGGIKVYQAGTGTLLGSYSATTDADGAFSVEMPGPGPGSYDVVVKGADTLSNRKTGVSLPSATEIDFGTLRVGDANGDDAVNGLDVSYMVPSFWKSAGETGFKSYADANRDGAVNGLDVSALIPNFWKSGPVAAAGP